MRNKKIKFLIIFSAIFGAVLVLTSLASSVLAAELNLGLGEVETEIALPTADIRVVIARIINIALGFVGIIIVLLVLYGGFLWMTAGGDEKKVETAKKVIINAVIGLIIVILAFAISSFVLRRLQEVAGENGPGGPGGGGPGGGGLPAGAFVVRGITPTGAVALRNITVRAVFSANVDPGSVSGNVVVRRSADGALVSGRLTSVSNVIEFSPDTPCPDGNGDGIPDAPSCFDADTDYRVSVSTGVRDTSGRSLLCGGLAPRCEGTFRSGNLVDLTPPEVTITSPDDGASLPADSLVFLQAFGRDDSGVSYIEFGADGSSLGSAVPSAGYANSEWNTSGVTIGSHTISARAFDFDSNSASAAPISVAIRPAYCFNGIRDADEDGIDCGGASCGTCVGGSCTANSDCSSGVCRAGTCVDIPRIDFVGPPDGRPGTLVTIYGAFFGSTPGRVFFRSANGEVAADPAPCAESWSDFQIVVSVPAAAISGPLRVEATSGESDTTSDARGSIIPDFIVNDVARPGICRIAPTSSRPDQTFTLEGLGFGLSLPGSIVSFGGRSAATSIWSDQSITGSVPRLGAGRVPVQVVLGAIISNPVYFSVLSLSAGLTPFIASISPESGPRGEYVTLLGDNFGEGIGTVYFRNPRTNDEARGDVSFPDSCSINFWQNNSITVKVPRRYADGATDVTETGHNVRVVRSDGAISNTIDFTVTSGSPSPGLCSINPNNGPVGTSVTLSGERFGIAAGGVIFTQNQRIDPPGGAWSDGEIRTTVPANAVTGPVRVALGNQVSNPVNFSVSNCNQNACTAGSVCCTTTGVCVREGSSCAGGALEGGYGWRVSTGLIPTTPRVVEECRDGVSPSPTPWDGRRGGNTVCVNAAINVRFTTEMDPASLVPGNILFERCTAAGADPCSSREPGFGRIDVTVNSFRFTPSAPLVIDSAYVVTLSTGIRASGLAGGNMEENATRCGIGNAYCFRFRTRADASNCALGSLVLDPPDYVSREMQDLNYNATALSADDICIALNSDAYNWTWSIRRENGDLVNGINPLAVVTNNDLMGSDGRVDAAQIVTTLLETVPNPPIYVQAAADGRFGRGRLAIDFTDPEVVETWPNCERACVNAEVAARFNTSMDVGTLTADRLMMRRCVNESCRTFDQEIAVTPSYDELSRTVRLLHGTLERSRYYRVFVSGSISSASGVNLTRLNYGEFYSWIFRTRDDSSVCEIASIKIDPASSRMTYLGEIRELRSTPISPPDECNPGGQRLSPTDYSWSWDVSNRSVATLISNGTIDVMPHSGTQGCSDTCLHTGSSANLAVCGNGNLERGEDCDEGDTDANDGCSPRCVSEGANAAYGSDCGDGTIQTGEDCDDGNTASGDGCSGLCLNEGSIAGSSICGSGDLGDGEDCDDGNTASGDGCSAECLHEGSVTGPVPLCGNRLLEAGEDCDDGNIRVGDGCGIRCLNEGRPACSGGVRNNCCGNGLTDVFEDFDDGNTASGDGYSDKCLAEGSGLLYGSICGNGASPVIRPPSSDLEAGEECEFTSRDSRIDPIQSAEARGQGLATVNSAVTGGGGINGIANLEVQCVCQSDLMCAGGGFPAGLGCGTDHCCSTRPVVEVVAPPDGSAGACRNSMLTAQFSTTMDAGSFTAQTVWLDIFPDAGVCPTGTLNNGWCESASNLRIGVRNIIDSDSGSNDTEKTILQFSSAAALRADKQYRARILGGVNGVKSKNGVAMGGDYIWTFTTGADICSLDRVEVLPSPITFLSTNPEENPKQASAVALSLHNGVLVPIAPIEGVYGWDWIWGTSDPQGDIVTIQALSPNQRETQIVTARPKNGQVTLTATAEITSDTFFNPTTARRIAGADIIPGRTVSDTVLVIVNLCENPWPARTELNWAPFIDEANNFSLYYCRDKGIAGTADDLPELGTSLVPVPPLPSILREYLFPAICPVGSPSCAVGDALGLRIITNGSHLSPLDWYRSQGFGGAPAGRMVDGYSALEDGRTIYVNAANKIGDPIYTNIFVFSYNEGAGGDVKDVRDQLLANWKFSINVGSSRICVNVGNSIILSEPNRTPIFCTSDLDCQSVSGFCNSGGDKLRRDTIRLGDARSIEITLNNYGASHRHCSRTIARACIVDANCPSGEECVSEFPHLRAGTFIPSITTSRWPSWQIGLGTELGAQLPIDPLNALAACAIAGADPDTCWYSTNQTYSCSELSNIYHYRNRGGASYDLGIELEFGETPQASNPLLWFPSPMTRLDPNGSYDLQYDAWCQDPAVILSASNLCGDGIVGPAEECESPKTDIRACLGGAGRSGWENLSCGRDCQWISAGCQTGRCGDGIVQSPENCDDGSRNGSYGHCNVSCSGIGDRCGDSVRNGPEVCDEGANNGVYDGCAWDCRSNPGTFCGDKTRNGNEACDGEQGVISVVINGVTDICGIDNQTGYQMAHNCRPAGDGGECTWGACVMTGLCGNGIKEGTEQCDDGNQNNTDACLNTCRTARCGDGYTRSGTELCDSGASNGVPCSPGYGISCTYCSNNCNPATVSGGSCGDGRVTGPEVCDGNLKLNNAPLQSRESCHGNCLALCPPAYEERGITWSKPGVQAPLAASIEIASNEEVTMIIPACNVSSDFRNRCEGGSEAGTSCRIDSDCAGGGVCVGGAPITTDLIFTEAEPAPMDVVFVTDLSGSMRTTDAECGDPDNNSVNPGDDSRIECTRAALKNAIDSLFDSYPRGLLSIGLVSFGAVNNAARMDTPDICGEDRLCDDPTAHRRALKDAVDAYVASWNTPTSLGVDYGRCMLLGSRPGSQDVLHNLPVPTCPDPITRNIEDLRNNIKIMLLMSDGDPTVVVPRNCITGRIGNACASDAECNTAGTCSQGTVGAACSINSDCDLVRTCTSGRVGVACVSNNDCDIPRVCSLNSPRNAGGLCVSDAFCGDLCSSVTGRCMFSGAVCVPGGNALCQALSPGTCNQAVAGVCGFGAAGVCSFTPGTCSSGTGYEPTEETIAIKTSHIFTEGEEQVEIPPAYIYSLAFTTSNGLIKNMIDWSSDCRTFDSRDVNGDGIDDWDTAACPFSDGAAGTADDLNAHNADSIHEEYGYWSSSDLTPLFTSIIGSITSIRVTLTSEIADDEDGNYPSATTIVSVGGDRPLTVPRYDPGNNVDVLASGFICRDRPQELTARIIYKGRGTMRVSDTKLIACYP